MKPGELQPPGVPDGAPGGAVPAGAVPVGPGTGHLRAAVDAAVPLVALAVSRPVGAATLGFYIAYRSAEDYLIVPRIMAGRWRCPRWSQSWRCRPAGRSWA